MGGDEFILLCGGFETEAQANTFAQRIKSALTDAGKDEQAWTSVSVGKARAFTSDKLEAVLEAADIDLYQDKKQSRQHHSESM